MERSRQIKVDLSTDDEWQGLLYWWRRPSSRPASSLVRRFWWRPVHCICMQNARDDEGEAKAQGGAALWVSQLDAPRVPAAVDEAG
jgi:hypothetical protein